MDNKIFLFIFFFIIIFLLAGFFPLSAEDRFPRPEFQQEYELPEITTPSPRDNLFYFLDTAVLVILLLLVSYFALKKRSRTGIFICSLFSLIYFGFWKQGCICPIGSIQNITYALFNSSYTIPIYVAFFFALPLLFSLFFGRVFCGGVCPFGALQDLVAIKPIQLPEWIENTLGIVPVLYLGFSVLLVATGSGFLICRFDPFVGFFRFGATFEMFIAGALFLIVGVFIARPYCRFVCPYGVLLKWTSRISQWHLKITPDECIECKLCKNVCPVGAIREPNPNLEIEKKETGIKRLMILFLILPVVMAGTGFLTSSISHIIAHLHPQIQLTKQIYMENNHLTGTTTDASETFRATGLSFNDLRKDADEIFKHFYTGSWIFGLYAGLMIMLLLIKVSIIKKRTGYEPDKEACVSCGRCFEACPKEQEKRKRKNENKII